MPRTKHYLVMPLMALTLCLGGCEILYFLGGKGSQAALYTIPKDKRVLVLVDVHESVTAPPAFAANLGEKISTHLYRNNAADRLVSQDRVVSLQQSDPAAYKKMGVADIAKATDADIVMVVYVTQLSIPVTTDGTVASGDAQIQVKIIDRNGERLWPGDVVGNKIDAHVDSAFTSERDVEGIVKELTDILSVRTGRMFHPYNLEDKTMLR